MFHMNIKCVLEKVRRAARWETQALDWSGMKAIGRPLESFVALWSAAYYPGVTPHVLRLVHIRYAWYVFSTTM